MYECACRSGKIMTTGISTMKVTYVTLKMEVWKAGEAKYDGEDAREND